jgi:N-acetyl-anhydromuramyl-L-alanine amidase AmpD
MLIDKGEFKNCYFAPFTDSQINSAKNLIIALKEAYSFTKEDFLYSHHQFDPNRKDDAGPIWMDQILPTILNEVYSA